MAKKPEPTLFEKLSQEVSVPEPLVVTDEITLYCPTKRQLEESQKFVNDEEASSRVLIGEHYDSLLALFEDKPPHLWQQFNKVYLNHFFDIPIES